MKIRLALLALTLLAASSTVTWAEGPAVKHDRLEISDLIEQSISVLYTNRGGNQAFNVATSDILSFTSGQNQAWLLPVLNGNADSHALRSGQCDVLIYKADTDYLTPIQFSHVGLGDFHDDQCVGFNRPLIVTIEKSAFPLVIFPTNYGKRIKTTVWRVLAYDESNESFCFAPQASQTLTQFASTTQLDEKNAAEVFKRLNLPAEFFKCVAPTKVS